jgi:aspartate racemase
MKVIGLIGGTSWVSTIDYYRLINEGINARLGDLNAAQCIIYSFNFQDIKRNNDNNDWDNTFNMVSKASRHLVNAGAEAIILCANTMHLLADRVQDTLDVPLIHIATATASEIKKQRLNKVALLGTRFTMERDFFKEKLKEQDLDIIIPPEDERIFLHHTIFEELGRNIFTSQTKKRYLDIIVDLIEQGSQGIVLGCTEIPLLIKPEEVSVPVFDTLKIHAEAAVDFSLD